jgi:diguanylate cyclase (GGDEF)-like protein
MKQPSVTNDVTGGIPSESTGTPRPAWLAAAGGVTAGRPSWARRKTAPKPEDAAAPSALYDLSGPGDYFAVSATPRFRASQRGGMNDSARHGMALVFGAGLLDCIMLSPLHPNGFALVVVLNAALAMIAALAYLAIRARPRWHPEAVVFLVLIGVDGATIALGVLEPELGAVAAGYLLLLPAIVALVVLWQTKIHARWLLAHSAAVICFALFAPAASLIGNSPGDLLTLLIVAITVSLFGHIVGLRARVLAFVQIERIRALHRQARRDEARLDRLNRILEKTARTDDLTGLKNRLSLRMDLVVIRARIARYDERYGLLMLDLDRFKAINDGFGHVAGDRVLQAIAGSFTDAVRVEDGVYRYGGEEFVVLMRLTEPHDALLTAQRLRHAVEALQVPNPGNPPHDRVTVSVGVAVLGQEDLVTDDDTWFARADSALYRAKAGGRNACQTEIVSSEVLQPQRPTSELAIA